MNFCLIIDGAKLNVPFFFSSMNADIQCLNSLLFSCCKAEHLSQINRFWVGMNYEIWCDKTIILCHPPLYLLVREGWLCKLDPFVYLVRYWNVEMSFIEGEIRFMSCFWFGTFYGTEIMAGLKKWYIFWAKVFICGQNEWE